MGYFNYIKNKYRQKDLEAAAMASKIGTRQSKQIWRQYKKTSLWAVHHSDKLPKKALISLIFRQNTLKSTKDFYGLLSYLKKIPILFRCYAVLKW